MPKTPASFIRRSDISGSFGDVRISRNIRLAAGSSRSLLPILLRFRVIRWSASGWMSNSWAWATANAGGKYDCLETINRNMKKLYNDPGLRLGSTVDLTMGVLQGEGKCSSTEEFNFLDAEGRPTVGVTPPVTLRRSLWDGLLAHFLGR